MSNPSPTVRPANEQIQSEITQTIRLRRRINEVRLGYARAFLLAAGGINLYFALDTIRLIHYAYLISFVLAVFVILMIHFKYHIVYSYLLPFIDATLMFALMHNVRVIYGVDLWATTGGVATLTAFTCIFIMSGVLRLRKTICVMTSILAIGLFTIFKINTPQLYISSYVITIAAMIVMAILSYIYTKSARRAIRAEVAELTLRRFIPEQIISRIYKAPLELFNKPRSIKATVLISDIRGFTALSEKLPPTELLSFLSLIQGSLSTVIHDNGGLVDKFLGDGILAVFGTFEEYEDHADRAVKSAFEMQKVIKEQNFGVNVGIGIHTGELVVGVLGAGKRSEFTVIGDTVNTASRIESLTKEKNHSILISDATQKSLQTQIESHYLGAVNIRGKTETIDLYGIDIK